jgi:ribonuclease J
VKEVKAIPNALKIIPFGGLGEVGKNMMGVEYQGQILIIDCGVMFPENDMLGIDLVIPDFGYLLDKKDQVCGVVITHGHEDHIGALPYLLKEIPVPVYAGRLTRGLIEVKLKRSPLKDQIELHTVMSGERVNIGPFNVEFFRVNHSIPDGMGIAIRTPAGMVVHSGDFKFDHTPVSGRHTDFAKLAMLGSEGVLALMADSTNSESPGFTPSEKVVEDAFEDVFRAAPGRVIVATFASLISRVQQVIEVAARHNRKVAIVGRSMVDNVRMAQELGYLKVPRDMLIRVEDLDKYSPFQIVIVATGSQGEPTSALARMARGERYGAKTIQISAGDTVIISASPIPGNEEMVNRIINRLFQRGANVVYSEIANVHVSGHASQEEQKLLLDLIKPKYFVPIHGELRHLHQHARLAREVGVPAENIFLVENGQVLEFEDGVGHVGERIPGGYVFVDGSGVGDIGPAVLRDRDALARDGFVVAAVSVNLETGVVTHKPELVSRGFVYLKDAEELMESAGNQITAALARIATAEGALTKTRAAAIVKDSLATYFHDETKRRPMIIPIVVEASR